MNIAEKNGQPSMEEILASIRRIIADEPQGGHPVIDIRSPRPAMHLVQADDDQADFELPSIFRPQQAVEKPAPLFGRLTDAIRQASGNAVGTFRNGQETFDPYQALATPNGAAPHQHDMPDPPLSALNMSRVSEPGAPLPAAAGPAPESAPVPAPAPESHVSAPQRSNGGWYAPAPQSSSPQSPEDVKRVMTPFRDTRMVRMSAMSAETYSPPAEVAAPEPAPAPVPVYAPSEPIAFFTPMPAPEVLAQGVVEGSTGIAVVTETGPSVAPPAATPAVEPPAHNAQTAHQPVDSIENATADLLRPMLRQWLAENMPRMVEKALHIEVAESVKGQR